MNYPLLICIFSLVFLWASARLGAWTGRRTNLGGEHIPEEYGIVLSATLTLLGLLIGFSFSMAITRYDVRNNYEAEEANAIGTEYIRADLLAEPVRQQVKTQLRHYVDLRIRRYRAHASQDITKLNVATLELQGEMWKVVHSAAEANPSPITAIVVTGMNDVINRQGYTQAARWNRIPLPAWALMSAIALFSNFLIGFGEKGPRKYQFLIVPVAIAVSFLLIADIDSPQGGLIWVVPHNLEALANSLQVN